MGVWTLYTTGGTAVSVGVGLASDSLDDGVGGLEAGGRLGVTEADLGIRGGRIEPGPKVRDDDPEEDKNSWEPKGSVEGVTTGGAGRGRRLMVA